MSYISKEAEIVKHESFAQRLNLLLDHCDFPRETEDREIVFCEYIGIPRPKARMILEGNLMPRKSIIEKIAEALYVEEEALAI